MNVGKVITKAMQAQRRRDILRLWRRMTMQQSGARHALQAYWWWGWDINSRDPWGRGGIGKPGSDL